MLVGLKLSLWIAQTMLVGLSYLMCVWLLLFFPIEKGKSDERDEHGH